MKIGDLVARTYGEGQRPVGLLVGWYKRGTKSELAEVMWLGSKRIEQFGVKYLEKFSESR